MKILSFFVLLTFTMLSCKIESGEKIERTPAASMCAPDLSDQAWYRTDGKAPLFDGLGDLHFEISTDNELVQRYFNQGIILSHGFNHAEAARSFYYASKLDPDCAMAHWGYAYVLGPNYNAPMNAENYKPSFSAIQKAKILSVKNTTQKEKDLIDAMAKRYVEEPVEGRFALDLAYSKALERVYKKYPADANIGTLYAESLMNLHPWNLYDKSGAAREWTPEILTVLESIIEKSPKHPGAHHYYIHAVEASANPSKGIPSAEIFDKDLVPKAGHLVHMPSHIYIRTGDYAKGTASNIRAIEVDSAYVSACHAQGVYPLTYYPHKQHFMSATATLAGNSSLALEAANAVSKNANKQLMAEPGWGSIQHYYTIPFYVYVKFARWSEILDMENEAPKLDYPSAIYHYARGMAFSSTGDLQKAKQELFKLTVLSEKFSLKNISIWEINSVYELAQIASLVLEAEIAGKEGNLDECILLLQEAIAIEDELNYNEPPDWFFSVRHHLGKALIKEQKIDEAIDVYLKDLENHPKNGWALSGLAEAYKIKGNQEKLVEIQSLYEIAWSMADIELSGSAVKN